MGEAGHARHLDFPGALPASRSGTSRNPPCRFWLSRFQPSTRCSSASGRSRFAGTRSPISSASCWDGCMRARCSSSESLWSGPPPMTVDAFDDFVLWVTLGIILGGRIGYVLFYNLGYFVENPLEDLPALEGRHVLPRRLPRLPARGRAVRALPQDFDPVARRPDLRGRHDRAVPRPHRQFHQRRAVGAARPTCLGR